MIVSGLEITEFIRTVTFVSCQVMEAAERQETPEKDSEATEARAWKAWWPCQVGRRPTRQCPPAGPSKGAFAAVSSNKGSADQSFFSREAQTLNSYLKSF